MFCWHSYVAVAIEHDRWVPKWLIDRMPVSAGGAPLTPAFGNKITTVLYRCSKCGVNATRELDGRWTLEQIRGER